ncbi:MAG: ribosome maturation factor RimP [Clostridiales bacterium]|nr:ribosome maturation factor RimP [Clostridiales bacterium]
MRKNSIAKMIPILEKLANSFHYELVDVAVEKENTGKYLRIYLDKQEGITLDDCEQYHRQVQPLVEDIDYDFLEVSSPGIDRPLKSEKDFLRHIGQEVEMRFYKALEGKKSLTGTLLDFNQGIIRLQVNNEEKTFSQKDIAVVKLFIDMDQVKEILF